MVKIELFELNERYLIDKDIKLILNVRLSFDLMSKKELIEQKMIQVVDFDMNVVNNNKVQFDMDYVIYPTEFYHTLDYLN
jgi:hypothetical protein